MKVKIGNVITDSEQEPIVLIFKDDAQRKHVASLLTNMSEKEGVRMYGEFPEGTKQEDADSFMEI